jgi:NMD protein affecting ribosome stability and mRNA decay
VRSDKGTIRALARRGTEEGRLHRGEEHLGKRVEPMLCEGCGATLVKRRWRRPAAKPTHDLLARARWTVCPACEQQGGEVYLGRIVIADPGDDAGAIRRRIGNVAKRAEFTQVERRIVSIEKRKDGGLEVLTTSQKLAHRIVHELKKAFGGRAQYRWLDDGLLEASWRPRVAA